MKLTAKVVGLEAGSQYVDKKPRVMLEFLDLDSMHNYIRMKVDSLAGWELESLHAVEIEQTEEVVVQ